jgi:hypothetical protein
MKDCRECHHSKLSYGSLLCLALPTAPRKVEFMRHERSDCGIEARLFDAKSEAKYAVYDDV